MPLYHSSSGFKFQHVMLLMTVMDNNEVLQNLNDECCIYGDECDGLPKCEDFDDGLETDPSETETSNTESFGEILSK